MSNYAKIKDVNDIRPILIDLIIQYRTLGGYDTPSCAGIIFVPLKIIIKIKLNGKLLIIDPNKVLSNNLFNYREISTSQPAFIYGDAIINEIKASEKYIRYILGQFLKTI